MPLTSPRPVNDWPPLPVSSPDASPERDEGPLLVIEPVEELTGEEDEHVVSQLQGRLMRYDTDAKDWRDCGVGQIRLNEIKDPFGFRLGTAMLTELMAVMREENTQRAVLNARLFDGMHLEWIPPKRIRFVLMKDDKPVSLLLSGAEAEATEKLYQSLRTALHHLTQLKSPLNRAKPANNLPPAFNLGAPATNGSGTVSAFGSVSSAGPKLEFRPSRPITVGQTAAFPPQSNANAARLEFRPSKPISVGSSSSGSLQFRPSQPIQVSAAQSNASSGWDWVASDEKLAPKPLAANESPAPGDKRKRESTTAHESMKKLVTEDEAPVNKMSTDSLAMSTTSDPSTQQKYVFGSTATTENFAALLSKETGAPPPSEATTSTTAPSKLFGASSNAERNSAFSHLATTEKNFDTMLATEAAKDDAENTVAVPTAQMHEVFTGEEGEMTLFRARCNLKFFDASTKEWKQRGNGPLHVNIRPDPSGAKSRAVMRNAGTLGLVLNAPLFPGMELKRVQEKSLVFCAVSPTGVTSYAIKFDNMELADQALMAMRQASDPEMAEHILHSSNFQPVSSPVKPPEPAPEPVPTSSEPEATYSDISSSGDFDEYNGN